MIPARECVPLSADEHLKFNLIVDKSTFADPRRSISDALEKMNVPQSWFVQDAWQRVLRRIWRTAP